MIMNHEIIIFKPIFAVLIGFIIFFASFELLEWISSEICQTTGNWWWWTLKTRIDS